VPGNEENDRIHLTKKYHKRKNLWGRGEMGIGEIGVSEDGTNPAEMMYFYSLK